MREKRHGMRGQRHGMREQRKAIKQRNAIERAAEGHERAAQCQRESSGKPYEQGNPAPAMFLVEPGTPCPGGPPPRATDEKAEGTAGVAREERGQQVNRNSRHNKQRNGTANEGEQEKQAKKWDSK